MNNIKLESHGYTIVNDTIAALRLIKNSSRKGGIDKFPITRKWLIISLNHMQSTKSQRKGKMKKRNFKLQKKLLQLLLRQESKSFKQFEMKLKSVSCK